MVDGARKREIFRAVAIYWVISLVSVGLNRLVLASAHAGPDDDTNVQKVDAPIFIAFFQVWLWVTCALTRTPSQQLNRNRSRKQLFSIQSILTVVLYLARGKGPQLGDTQPKAALRDILPLSFIFTLMVLANSLCLRHVDVSLFQVFLPLSSLVDIRFHPCLCHCRIVAPILGL